MTDRYARSTDGNNTDDGSTWALAKLAIAGLAAIDAASDSLWLSDAHDESTASAVAAAFAGTNDAPTKLLCGDDAAEPPTALAASAFMRTTGSGNGITLNGALYAYGVSFYAGNETAINADLALNATALSNGCKQVYDNCTLSVANGSSADMRVGQNSSSNYNLVELWNCTLRFPNTNGTWTLYGGLRMRGGGLWTSGALITRFASLGGGRTLPSADLIGVDLSRMSTTADLFAVTSNAAGIAVVRECKLPDSWAGQLLASSSVMPPGGRLSLYYCSNSTTLWRMWIEDYAGNIKDDSVIVMTGGASDSAAYAWKITSNANCNEYVAQLVADEIPIWVAGDGVEKTVTLHFLHDSTTDLTDADIWVDVTYLATAGSRHASIASNKRATVLTTPAAHAASAETWVTTGLTNPRKQKLEVSFTPNEDGVCFIRVCVGKTGDYTIWLDPLPVVT